MITTINNSIRLSPENILDLDQQWKTIVSPQVCLKWADFINETEQSKAKKEVYKFGETIAKIQSFQSQGKSICLFMGRTPLEKLPPDHGEAKENEIWISSDIAWISPEGYEELKNTPDVEERLHLWVNFNHQESLYLIKGLFDKIVIDQSTTKALKNDFARRFAILLRNSESKMIFENPVRAFHCFTPLPDDFEFDCSNYSITTPMDDAFIDKEEKIQSDCYKEYRESTSKEDIQRDLNDYLESSGRMVTDPDFEDYFANYIMKRSGKNLLSCLKKIGIDLFKEHLERIYNSVEQHQNTNYPYTTNYSEKNNDDHYFLLSNPKI